MITPPRQLLIHADDFGMCASVNTGIVEAFERGAISAASIMVPCPAAEEAVRLSVNASWDIGVHLTLTSEWKTYRWRPISPPHKIPSLIDSEGFFWKNLDLFTRHAVAEEVALEINAQLTRAYEMGLRPTHMDCHMYCLLRNATLYRIYKQTAEQWQLPALGYQSPSAPTKTFSLTPVSQLHHFTALYTKMIFSDWAGIAQLTIHPGHETPELRSITQDRIPWGAAWRQADLAAVCNPELQNAVKKAGLMRVGWRTDGAPNSYNTSAMPKARKGDSV